MNVTAFIAYIAMLVVPLFCTDGVHGLQCWHCIAEDCNEDPSDNYKASKKPCNIGQSCQKVYFEMYSDLDKRQYESTVRGCSTNCQPKDDFVNCSKLLKSSRGCVRKDCCDDSDLCNGADLNRPSSLHSVMIVLCLVLTLNKVCTMLTNA